MIGENDRGNIGAMISEPEGVLISAPIFIGLPTTPNNPFRLIFII